MMNNRHDRMLQLVLSDEKLIGKYGINPADYPTMYDAAGCGNPVVECVVMIINGIKDNFDESDQKALYTKIRNHLNDTLLI